jgi:Uma2 family endonuclease
MSTATAPLPLEPQSEKATLADVVNYVKPGQHVLVTGVSWDDYERLLLWRDENRKGARLTYDRGDLEIMVVTSYDERLRKILALLIESWLAETGGEYVPSGQFTHKRKDLEKGFEPDECYYVQSWKKVAGLREIDLLVDPPPDLTVEVEVSRTIKSRLPILASFRIPEVWRYNGKKVTVLRLGPKGKYQEAEASLAIPDFPFADAPRFLEMAASVEVGFATIDRQFRGWIRSLPPTKRAT